MMKTLILLLLSSKAFAQIPSQASMLNYPTVNGSTITIRCLAADGVTYQSCQGSGGGGSPGGSSGNIQYNQGGSFGGASNANYTNSLLTVNEATLINNGAMTVGVTTPVVVSSYGAVTFTPSATPPVGQAGLVYISSVAGGPAVPWFYNGTTYVQLATGTYPSSFSSTDFGPSTAALSNSTISLQNQLNAVIVSTGQLSISTQNIKISLNAVIVSTGQLSVSTQNIQTSLNAVIVSTGQLSVSTQNIQTNLNAVIVSTGQLSVSTQNIQTNLNSVIVSTGQLSVSTQNLQSNVNWLLGGGFKCSTCAYLPNNQTFLGTNTFQAYTNFNSSATFYSSVTINSTFTVNSYEFLTNTSTFNIIASSMIYFSNNGVGIQYEDGSVSTSARLSSSGGGGGVTSVSGTYPINSSGGNIPTISLANTFQSSYTFNGATLFQATVIAQGTFTANSYALFVGSDTFLSSVTFSSNAVLVGEYFGIDQSSYTINLSSSIYFNAPMTGINWQDGSYSTSGAIPIVSNIGATYPVLTSGGNMPTISLANTFQSSETFNAATLFQATVVAQGTFTANSYSLYVGSSTFLSSVTFSSNTLTVGEYFGKTVSTYTINISSSIYFNNAGTGINYADGSYSTSAALQNVTNMSATFPVLTTGGKTPTISLANTLQSTFTINGSFLVNIGSVTVNGPGIFSQQTTNIGSVTFNGNTVFLAAPTLISSLTVHASGLSPAAVFTPNLSSFTATGALSGTFANTNLGPCITGSTLTLTLPAGISLVAVHLHGTVSDSSLAAIMGAGIILDGLTVDGESGSKGLTAPAEAVATDGTNISFTEILSGLSSGVHNICLSLFDSAGTGTIDSTNSVMKMQAYMLP